MPTAESTRIAGQMVATEATASLGIASATLLGPSATRKKIIFLAPASGQRYTVSTFGTAVLDQGITVNGGGPPVIVDEEQYGNWPQKQLQAIASVALTADFITIVITAG